MFNEKGDVAGVAFSKEVDEDGSLDNIGFIIPATIVRLFLEQYFHTATFTGTCCLGFRYQTMENEHIRAAYGSEDLSGVLVTQVEHLAPLGQVLKVDDCLLEIDGIPIANDGTISFDCKSQEMVSSSSEGRIDDVVAKSASQNSLCPRILFEHLITGKKNGSAICLKVLREKKCMEFSQMPDGESNICLSPVPRLIPLYHLADAYPTYFIYCGLVFCPLSMPCFEAMEESYSDNFALAMALAVVVEGFLILGISRLPLNIF